MTAVAALLIGLAAIPLEAQDPELTGFWELPGTAFWMKVGGYVKADVIYDVDGTRDPDQFLMSTIPVEGDPNYQAGGYLHFTAKETRFNVDIRPGDRTVVGALHVCISEWSLQDLNLRPPRCERGALPAELSDRLARDVRGPDESAGPRTSCSTPTGTRTPVFAVRGRYPRPLDDGGVATWVAEGPNLTDGASDRSTPQRVPGFGCRRDGYPFPTHEVALMPAADTVDKLSAESVRDWLRTRKGWSRRSNQLIKDFRFPSFRDSIVFVNRIATLADEFKHHPDIDVRYTTVTVMLTTHDAGGITEKDVRLAEQIDFATSAS